MRHLNAMFHLSLTLSTCKEIHCLQSERRKATTKVANQQKYKLIKIAIKIRRKRIKKERKLIKFIESN